MDTQVRPGFDGSQGAATPAYAAKAPLSDPLRLPGYILRIKAVLLTLVATIVMGAANQTVTRTAVDPSTGDILMLQGTAKSIYSASFVYFIVVNSIVFVYSSISMALSITNQARSNKLALPFSVADLVMTALLFSSNGAATAVIILMEKGNAHTGWDQICSDVGKFCGSVTAAIVLSMVASVAYVLLMVLSIVGLHKRAH